VLPVAWELQTTCGSIDLLFVNSEGMITIVETKLWRNPEARRKVVTQIIDYAKDLAKWSYSDLMKAVKASIVMLGAVPMEVMDLVISPAAETIVVNAKSPNIPSAIVK